MVPSAGRLVWFRRDLRATQVNGARRSRIRTFIKKVENAIASGDKEAASAALRAAQVELSKHPRWSAPFYWAGLVLQGEYR